MQELINQFSQNSVEKNTRLLAYCLSMSVKVIVTDTDRPTTYDLLLLFHSNHMGHSCTDRQRDIGRNLRFFSTQPPIEAPAEGSLELVTVMGLKI